MNTHKEFEMLPNKVQRTLANLNRVTCNKLIAYLTTTEKVELWRLYKRINGVK